MSPKNHRWLLCLLAGVTLAAASCSPPSSGQVQHVFPGGTWEQNNILTLTLPVPDTTFLYDAFLDLRVTREYASSYLSIIVTRNATKDTLWFSLIGREAINSGLFTDYRFPLDTPGFSTNKPFYTWQLSHNMQDETLAGIATIGLLIKKQEHGKR